MRRRTEKTKAVVTTKTGKYKWSEGKHEKYEEIVKDSENKPEQVIIVILWVGKNGKDVF